MSCVRPWIHGAWLCDVSLICSMPFGGLSGLPYIFRTKVCDVKACCAGWPLLLEPMAYSVPNHASSGAPQPIRGLLISLLGTQASSIGLTCGCRVT
ncbi:hypothetical protein V6N11_071609 [Hibiscus sabdariffa]|uniref:Secreted protein n=1 Tax=Hibiscus sabdariffa TaxID=183260 RepID=A0ABR2U0U8_9ROSI